MSKGLFITGTGTDIGKTYVSALLVKLLKENGIDVAYFKPALSGAIFKENGKIECDAQYVIEKAHLKDSLSSVVPYLYKTAVSPHLASKIEDENIDLKIIKTKYDALSKKHEYITVEGCGGIVCPIRQDNTGITLQEDIIKTLGLGCVIVADSSLGTINSTVLTVEYIKSKNIPIKGIILNKYEKDNFLHIDNKKMIEMITNIKVIATVAKDDTILKLNKNDLIYLYE